MTIDTHAHLTLPAFSELLKTRNLARLHQKAETAEERLAALDAAGIDGQVLSLPGLAGIDSLPAEEAAPLVRAFNSGIAEVVAAHPERFAGLASLPHSDIDAAVIELEYALDHLHLRGAILPVDAFQDTATAEKLRPIFQAGEARGAHFFIHPGAFRGGVVEPLRLGNAEVARDVSLKVAVKLQTRITSAYLTLAFTDFLEAFPSVTIQLANLGGVVPFLVERLDHPAKRKGDESLLPSLRKIFVDTASFGSEAIGLTARIIGADRVLFGTDHPIFPLEPTLEGLSQAQLSTEQRETILSSAGLDFFRTPSAVTV